jgi:hypothetical protein
VPRNRGTFVHILCAAVRTQHLTVTTWVKKHPRVTCPQRRGCRRAMQR